jgi:histidyl-tRNA synthetase
VPQTDRRTEILHHAAALLAEKGITNVRTDMDFARGQAYYTGLVFEFYDTNPENNRSLFGGGRYDNLLELFDAEPLPAVGIACGDIGTRDFLETHKLPLGNA